MVFYYSLWLWHYCFFKIKGVWKLKFWPFEKQQTGEETEGRAFTEKNKYDSDSCHKPIKRNKADQSIRNGVQHFACCIQNTRQNSFANAENVTWYKNINWFAFLSRAKTKRGKPAQTLNIQSCQTESASDHCSSESPGISSVYPGSPQTKVFHSTFHLVGAFCWIFYNLKQGASMCQVQTLPVSFGFKMKWKIELGGWGGGGDY